MGIAPARLSEYFDLLFVCESLPIGEPSALISSLAVRLERGLMTVIAYWLMLSPKHQSWPAPHVDQYECLNDHHSATDWHSITD